MEYRKVGGTSLTVSRLALGTLTFGAGAGEQEARAMVSRALDAGITLFDSADVYGDGRAEEILGSALGRHRDRVLVATKVGQSPGGLARPGGLRKAAIERALAGSLRRLGTDHVDLYYLHQPDWHTPMEETLEALDGLVRRGLVRCVGASNYAAWQLARLQCLADRHGWSPVAVSQPQYNLLSRRIEDEYVACSQELGLADVVYNPLAGGLLTGRHSFRGTPEAGSTMSRPAYRERYWNSVHFEAVGRLSSIAADAGLSLPALAFGWLLRRPVVDAVLIGASSLGQLEANVAAAQVSAPLEGAILDRCDAVWEMLRGVAPAYSR